MKRSYMEAYEDLRAAVSTFQEAQNSGQIFIDTSSAENLMTIIDNYQTLVPERLRRKIDKAIKLGDIKNIATHVVEGI